MSFREINQFVSILRKLGYPNSIGVDSFDNPNFGLMASLLQFLCQLFDPDLVLYPDLKTEHGRVEFIRGVVQQTVLKSGIRLNPKKLYASDKYSVRELMKLAAPIYKGIGIAATNSQQGNLNRDLVAKISRLSSTIPKKATDLYDQLGKELSIRDVRNKLLASVPTLDTMEKAVNEAVKNASVRGDVLAKEIARLESDEKTLNQKLKQKKTELDRTTKRLMSVQTVRPAYMDEFEGLEDEIGRLFQIYGQLYKNIDYMEKSLETIEEERKKKDEALTHDFNKILNRNSKHVLNKIQGSAKAQNQPQFQNQVSESSLDIMNQMDDDDDEDGGF